MTTCSVVVEGLVPLIFNVDASAVTAFRSFRPSQVAATVGQGGDTLVEMVTIKSLEDDVGGRFLATTPGKPDSAFAPQGVSVEAQDMAKAQRLWELSAGCVGLGAKTPI